MNLPPIASAERTPRLLRLVANGLTQALGGLLTLLLIRHLYQGDGGSGWEYAVAGLLLVSLLSAGLRHRERVDAEALGQSYAHHTRLRLFRHLCDLPLEQRQQLRGGSQMLRFVGDLGALQLWIGRGLSRVATALLTLLTGLAGLAWFDHRLALTELAVLAPLAALSLLQGRQLQGRLQQSRRRRAQLAANIHEKLGAIASIQLFGQQRREQRYLARQSGRLQRSLVQRAGVLGTLGATAELAVGATLAALFSVGYLSEPRPDGADLLMAFSLVILQTPALRQLSRVYGYWQGYRVARVKLEALLRRPGFTRPGGATEVAAGPVAPAAGDGWRLHGLSLAGRLQPLDGVLAVGSRTVLTGPSGGGKSSLLLALARLLDAPAGQLRYRGHALADTPLRGYRRRVGLVSEEAPLLSGSLRKNLYYRRGARDDAEGRRILALCGIDQLLATLPGGLDFRLRDGGRNLPRGQRMQIALARALLGHPQLLLIDDADRGLDPALRARVLRVIDQFEGTLVYSAQSDEFIRHADQCWRLQPGRRIDAPALTVAKPLSPALEENRHVPPPSIPRHPTPQSA